MPVAPDTLDQVCAVNSRTDFVRDYFMYEVTVDGAIAKDCIFASVDRGEAVCLVVGEHGIETDKTPGGANGPLKTLLRGVVAIRRTSRPVTDRYTRHYLNVFGKRHMITAARG
jgi:hypothetical protein